MKEPYADIKKMTVFFGVSQIMLIFVNLKSK